MPRIFYILLVALFAFTLSKKLKKKSKCIAFGGNCDLTSYCCDDFVCKDFRCSLKGTKDNLVPWRTVKCDWFRWCKDGYECQSHRCIKQQEK